MFRPTQHLITSIKQVSYRSILSPPIYPNLSSRIASFSNFPRVYQSMTTNPNPLQLYPTPPFNNARHQEGPGFESQMDPRADWGQDSYRGSEKLKDRVALITGGDSGIGRATAIAFGKEGCDVAISYLPVEQKDAEECKRMVEKSGRKCLLIPGDLAEKGYCSEIVEKTVQAYGKLDILVNNAASQGEAVDGIQNLEYDRIMRTFQVNIIAMFEVTKAAMKHLKPGGCIINTGSIQAYGPSHPILDYSCTKGAIVTFTKGLSKECAEKGIRVNCVAPGPIWTPLVASSFQDDKLRNFGEKYPFKRPGQPAEVAPAYVYLASNDSVSTYEYNDETVPIWKSISSFVTGEVLGVTGGGILA